MDKEAPVNETPKLKRIENIDSSIAKKRSSFTSTDTSTSTYGKKRKIATQESVNEKKIEYIDQQIQNNRKEHCKKMEIFEVRKTSTQKSKTCTLEGTVTPLLWYKC